MEKRSNVISGLKKGNHFSTADRHQLIQELVSSGCTKQEIWEKYTGETEEHGQLVRWMRQLGYSAELPARRPNLVENSSLMSKKKPFVAAAGDSFETLQLKKRITELESQLSDAAMKAIAFSTLIDIAEKEFNIPIRKKATTKPLKK